MNLWAEFDNQHQHAPAEPARHRQTRRLAEQAMLSSVRQWLLQDYASSYCRALAATRIYRRCYWIDAWGIDTGRDKSGPYELALQPIVSLSQVLAQESKPIALHGIVLEAGSSRRKQVRAILNGNAGEGESSSSPSVKGKSKTLPKQSGMVSASWLEIAPAL